PRRRRTPWCRPGSWASRRRSEGRSRSPSARPTALCCKRPAAWPPAGPEEEPHAMNMRTILSAVAIGAGALAIGACGDDDDSSTATSSGAATQAATQEGGGKSGKIALLLPESKTARYESQDRPGF